MALVKIGQTEALAIEDAACFLAFMSTESAPGDAASRKCSRELYDRLERLLERLWENFDMTRRD